MIPFEVDPSPYYIFAACIICMIFSLIIFIATKNSLFCTMSLMFLGLVFFSIYPVFTGSVYTDTITICAHTEGDYNMKVVDTNQNIYYIKDDLTKMKVKDNITVEVKIVDVFGYKHIYSIDAPITCGNQTCGVTS